MFDELPEKQTSPNNQGTIYNLEPRSIDLAATYEERVKALGQKYPTICVLPFIQLCTNNSGNIRMCNRSLDIPDNGGKGNVFINDYSTEEFFNREFLQKARTAKLNGEKLSACKRCYVEEEAGLISKRMRELYRFWDVSLPAMREAAAHGGVVESAPIYLDLKLGNHCNLACAYCSSTTSSSVYSDHVKMEKAGVLPSWRTKELAYAKKEQSKLRFPEEPSFWEKMESLIPTLNTVFFEGGEPTIQKPVKLFIQKMVESGAAPRIKLKFTTNMTRLTKDWLDLLAQFNQVSLFCSIDGLAPAQESIRYGEDFDVIAKNFEMAIREAADNIKIHLLPAISIFNVEGLVDLLRWKEQIDVTNRADIGVNTVFDPRCLCIKILPADIKDKVRTRLLEYIGESKTKLRQPELTNEIYSVIRFMDSPLVEEATARSELREYLIALETVRSKPYVKTYQHLLAPDEVPYAVPAEHYEQHP